MAALLLFAFLAGAGTALSPCVLPVLPVALSAGMTGGRRRPLGVVAGLVLSFTFAIVALVYLIDALGLPGDLLRNVAIVVLFGFGLSLLVPAVSARFEAWVSRIVPAARNRGGDGFGSGLLVGLSLGVVYAPCAGPILAGVITVSASQPLTADRVAVALAYALGSALVLYLLLLGGRRLTGRLGRYAGRLQMAMGALMVAVAVLMAADYDTRFQTAIADDLPAIVVNPTKELEESDGVRSRLAGLRGDTGHSPGFGPAPPLVGTQQWFNTPGEEPLTLRQLRGRVVLLDFWTYTCINCIRTLPHLKAWDEAYRDEGLTIVGVHTPEFPFERDADNVAAAIEQNELRYPVVQDNEYATWTAYGNEYWPTKYLIDARGRIRYAHFGEGDYEETERVIRDLLAEAGRRPPSQMTKVAGEQASALVTTPETYLGSARAEGFVNGPIEVGRRRFEAPPRLGADKLAYDGTWRIGYHGAASVRRSRLHLSFGARRVFLVLGSKGDEPRPLRVLLDGQPIPAALAGRDVRDGTATIREQRLYRLVELPGPERHLLTLEFAPGISGYAFTFG
ncbi:MAG TPA: cytochrome c biogenesis protein DipZ [Solirubrobacterales bacterium]|nr:cytochrome c biogenesis protein DipZ [Solirubrobacterales bacterium]